MKKRLLCLLVTGLILVWLSPAQARFTERPINVVVYLKPGGAGDIFTRRFVKIAEKYTDAKFVVLNKPGAGGLTAMHHIVSGKPDGYNLAFMTKSVIAKFVGPDVKIKIDDFEWLAMLVSDPESLIVNVKSPIRTLDQIIADAKAKKGAQLWVGPATGGNDHIMARKTWRALGIEAKWVPFESGEEAMTALMGGHGVVYVGNPEDVAGKPDLENVVISAPKRLGGVWANIPTFKELGVRGLDEEIMWRGFVIKAGIPEEARKFYHDIITKVSNDPTWRKYIEDAGAAPVFHKDDKLKEIVKEDFKDFAEIIKELGIK
ncbi:MAG: tripartite tricarboxylate transporter substrate binding protein [Thermodesulfobacteriota bacterium]|nr:tripartite tricarboxylate transporter substrate binding protein [Thermodesulfobacteriota bacterium]